MYIYTTAHIHVRRLGSSTLPHVGIDRQMSGDPMNHIAIEEGRER